MAMAAVLVVVGILLSSSVTTHPEVGDVANTTTTSAGIRAKHSKPPKKPHQNGYEDYDWSDLPPKVQEA